MTKDEFSQIQLNDLLQINALNETIETLNNNLGIVDDLAAPMDNQQGEANEVRASILKAGLEKVKAIEKLNSDRLSYLMGIETALKATETKNFEDGHNLNVYKTMVAQIKRDLKARVDDIKDDVQKAENLLAQIYECYEQYVSGERVYAPEQFGALQGRFNALIRDAEVEAQNNEAVWSASEPQVKEAYSFLVSMGTEPASTGAFEKK